MEEVVSEVCDSMEVVDWIVDDEVVDVAVEETSEVVDSIEEVEVGSSVDETAEEVDSMADETEVVDSVDEVETVVDSVDEVEVETVLDTSEALEDTELDEEVVVTVPAEPSRFPLMVPPVDSIELQLPDWSE